MSEPNPHIMSGSGKVFSMVNDFRKTGTLCDVKLVVDNKVFPAHKNILAGFSPYFEGMFVRDFAEARQDTVTVNSIDANIFESLLNYAYTDKITITCENVSPLLEAARYLLLQDLFEGACWFLTQNLSADNCVNAFNLAEVYSCQQLKERAKTYILSNFADVSNSVGYLELEAEKLVDIIDDNLLYVGKEEYVFDAVLRWFHYNEDRRKVDLAKVLRHVRLAHVDPSFLHSRLRTVKALRSTESVAKLMEEVMMYHLVPKQRNEFHSSFTKRRLCSPDVEVLFIHGKDFESKENAFLYVSEEGREVGEMPMCSAMYWWSACNYQMHVLSGDDKQSVKFFDSEASEWKTAFKLKRPFEGRSLLVNADGQWFSFGDSSAGKDNGPYKYDSTNQVWKKIADSPEAICNADVISLHGMIYVVGGEIKGRNASNRIQRYDPQADTWTQITRLPVSRKKPRVCGFNQRIYIFSGFSVCLEDEDDDARRVDVYDISTDQWLRCADIPQKLHRSYMTGPIVLGGRIHVLTQPDAPRILVYCPINDTWEDFDEMPCLTDFDVLCVQGPLLINRR